MRACNLVSARLLARKGIVDPTDFTSLLAWRLEHGNKAPEEPDVPDVPDVPAELLSWEGVAYHIEQGDYKDVYAVGDMIPLDLGSEGLINMQIAAFDADTLADGSGTAAISWVGKELLKTKSQVSTDRSANWETYAVRARLANAVKQLVPTNVRNCLVEVSKTQTAYDASGKYLGRLTTSDELWIPSKDELYKSGGVYTGLFSDDASRVKNLVGSATAERWWLRDAYQGSANYVNYTGGVSYGSSTNQYGICLGFCTGKTPT